MTTPAQGPVVLIVDDDARMREVMARWLASAAYETREAADAETAYAQWSKALALPTVQGLVIGRSLLYPPGGDVATAVDRAVSLL